MYHFDLAQLHVYLAVCEAGSISAAAPALCRSTSAISEQVRKLEDAVGVELLVRGKQGVRPTPAGERLLHHARQILTLGERALSDVRGEQFEGEIGLAITDYFRPDDIAGLLKKLREWHPRLRLHVAMKKSLEIDQAGDYLDIGLAMRFNERVATSNTYEVRREPLQWVAAAGWTPELGQPLPLLAISGCGLSEYSRQVLERNQVGYEIVYSTSGVAGLQSALRAGLGIACLNASAIPHGVAPYKAGLPELAQATFSLLPPRKGESALVENVRRLLLGYLA
ncbi:MULTISPECIES: LysR family transcriptional regulator [unclassified Pseudomonas]|uniref:LysR family transcriptional regulator n=1 Tax=unclassified Pseudomonas TaxID=196821 RepID=UPI000BDBD8A4|nr:MULTISPECIES: LysR family transcriptional regulator [unclassified Pseudomonas]PVZ19896.1 DNA-binding transcriptional LysR family regulator [Pseudomonas sp. URIL14HWK12:I12]PVZ26962.1 DNA-binding transcriptional LysR family regulator [Pseudomonas sp. URIL14HWK12:I10]PVZ37851.1 DNA-binding transcriptional LysR family regulator [Pseudomonas sp. URIL14HWK12:I11]SNZ05414.1 DNA-binding transcriptional regulator, LysR family [Pseudomonas sp. URIL14HWK12:I9]